MMNEPGINEFPWYAFDGVGGELKVNKIWDVVFFVTVIIFENLTALDHLQT
jgi:hypothetical protein